MPPKKKGKKVKTKAKSVKKRWVEIFAPKLFQEVSIGKVYTSDEKLVLGRKFEVNLMSLTRDPKKQNIRISFEITGQKQGGVETTATGFKMSPASVKRKIRRGKEKVEDSFVIRTKDKKLVRVKPLFVTRSLAANSSQADVRKAAQEFLKKKLAKISYESFLQDIVQYKLQREMFGLVNKIFPVSVCEIRQCLLVEQKRGARRVIEEVKEEAVEEVKEEAVKEAEA